MSNGERGKGTACYKFVCNFSTEFIFLTLPFRLTYCRLILLHKEGELFSLNHHIAMHINVKSTCTSETTITLYAKYTLMKIIEKVHGSEETDIKCDCFLDLGISFKNGLQLDVRAIWLRYLSPH